MDIPISVENFEEPISLDDGSMDFVLNCVPDRGSRKWKFLNEKCVPGSSKWAWRLDHRHEQDN